MPTIEIHFPGRRYHAATSGTHVNEGRIEWPPSPWRVLRALLAVGYTRLQWDAPPPAAVRLIEQLSGALPSYRLPTAVEAHTRHYMPVIAGRKETKTKVLDSFLRFVSDEPLRIHYDVSLDDECRSIFERLADGLTYLGRAESWADAKLVDDAPFSTQDSHWTVPNLNGSPPPDDGDQISVLAAVPAAQYLQWRQQSLERQLEVESVQRGTPLTKLQRGKLEAVYPNDLLACLQWDTADIKQHKWNQPPGSRRVLYDRLRPDPVKTVRPRVGSVSPPVEAALIRLAIDRREAARLPSMTRGLPQAEAIHLALVSILCKELELSSPAITGRTDDRRPLESKHQHAHYVPLDLDNDGSIDHMLIHAPMGLDHAAQQSIRRLRRTWAKGIPSILLRWVGFGSLDDFRGELRMRGGGPPAVLGESTVLESVTPYVPPRWLKAKNGRYTLEDDVRRELTSRDLPIPNQIDVWNDDYDRGRQKLAQTRLLSFARTRQKKKPQPPQRLAFGLTLHFGEPVKCPLAIGYASHFGLGLFGARSEA